MENDTFQIIVFGLVLVGMIALAVYLGRQAWENHQSKSNSKEEQGAQSESLEEMRKSIDNIDNAIVAMLAERFKMTNRVGYYKAECKLPSKDLEREAEQQERIIEIAEQYGLDPEFAKSYLEAVIERVINNHEKIATQVQLEKAS